LMSVLSTFSQAMHAMYAMYAMYIRVTAKPILMNVMVRL